MHGPGIHQHADGPAGVGHRLRHDEILPVASVVGNRHHLVTGEFAAPHRQLLRNDPARCAPGAGASVMLTITNIADGQGRLRVQAYRGTRDEWLAKGRWLNRIELPARSGTVRVRKAAKRSDCTSIHSSQRAGQPW